MLTGCLSMSLSSRAQRVTYHHVFAPSEGLVNRTEKPYRSEVCLNGYWDFQAVDLPSDYVYGKGQAPELPKPADDGWDPVKIKIPSPWNINDFANRGVMGPDHRNYPSYPKKWEQVGMAWMRKKVIVPKEWTNQEVRLYFEAVAGNTEVYVNGNKVGENFDLFLPFSFDVTRYVQPGETAEILVGVRSQKLFEDRSTIGRRIVPAGSMWGYHINGIWQDVYLVALPTVNIRNVYVKPLVSQKTLEIEVTVQNSSQRDATLQLGGTVREWINRAGLEINSAPVPNWRLGNVALKVAPLTVKVKAGATEKAILRAAVKDGSLDFWTPESPNLYALLVNASVGKKTFDLKYERFGWREWTFNGTQMSLNGKPYTLRSDSWHFMGIPQMTRRYAWAWFTAIKHMNGNAVRLHAQVYPRLYQDVADEMGICILDETANWASDGGPKLDSPTFWAHSRDHLRRFVERDRNHASVFGWSISNENQPVILYVFQRPDLMPQQKKAWEEWRDIVRATDSTRPWISSDGEDDGDGILPVTVGHYGDLNSMKKWRDIGKPWGIGETGMCYYGTPEQVAKVNGERAYESQEARMEGLATECYQLVKSMREMGAAYSTVFNMAWYGLKPLPLGKKNLTTAPTLDDGIFFDEYKEGVPGVQPERVGPYCSTFNPGYDPQLPLYETWPLYDALRAAYADEPAWSKWAEADKEKYAVAKEPEPTEHYRNVVFVGDDKGKVKALFDAQGVEFSKKVSDAANSLYIVDATQPLGTEVVQAMQKNIDKGTDVWIWGLNPETASSLAPILPAPVSFDKLNRSTFIPEQRSWIRGLNNSDFYFCELQNTDVCNYTLKGALVDEGEVLLNACRTDWRKWNKQAEEIKTASTLRSEYECTAATPVFVKYQKKCSATYVSTLTEFANSERGYNTLNYIIRHAGVRCHAVAEDPSSIFFLRDNRLNFPRQTAGVMQKQENGSQLTCYVYSNRPLDDLLIEPNVPKLTLHVHVAKSALTINGQPFSKTRNDRNFTEFYELPLKQGWNRLTITLPGNPRNLQESYFRCDNRQEYMPTLKASLKEMQ